MRIYHQTTIATIIQFVVGSALSFITGVGSIASGCYGQSSADCVTNTFVSLLLVLLTVGAYGALVAVGYLAQARRSKRLALLLIGLEAGAMVVFSFDAKQSPSTVDRFANLAALAVAAWVAFIAFNLFRSGNSRVVARRAHTRLGN